ncbi:MAG TPA: S8 family peptidase [Acidobacteriaceae bacterium]
MATKSVWLFSIGMVVLAGALAPSAAVAQGYPAVRGVSPTAPGAKLSKDAQAADPAETVHVIVRFNHTDEAAWDVSLSASHGLVHKHFKNTQAVAAEMPASALKQLANDPSVAYVSIDRPVGARGGPGPGGPGGPQQGDGVASISTNPEYTADAVNAPAVWAQGYYGTGVAVAVIDSGIMNLPDLGPQKGSPQRILYNASFPATLAGGTQDSFGHGTHVAGLIGGNGSHSIGKPFSRTFLGVAPNVNLINLRVLDGNGQGTDSTVIEAIEAAIALKNTYNIRVINLSLGRPIWESYQQDPLCQAAEAAWQAGIVVVVAAGNAGRNQNLNPEGYGTIEAPGNDPYVITVGAMNTMHTASVTDDVMTSYSSKGPSLIDQVAKPDLVAPGNLVTSLLKGGSALQTQNPTFFTPNSFYHYALDASPSPDYMPLSGTSMAAGVTSGAVALLLQAQPQLSPDQVKALLMYSAQRSYFPRVSTATDPVTGAQFVSHYDLLTVGAGYLDIAATLNNVATVGRTIPSGTAMSPVVSFDPNSGNVTLVTDQTALWGRSAPFAASGVYGENAFVGGVNGTTALWGRTAILGADDPSGFSALWGTTALWGRATPDAATALWGRTVVDSQAALSASAITDAN